MSLHTCPIEPSGDDDSEEPNCKECEGEGTVDGEICPKCDGTGSIDPSDPEPDMSEFI